MYVSKLWHSSKEHCQSYPGGHWEIEITQAVQFVKIWESTEHYLVKFMAFAVSKWSLQAANLGDMEFVLPEKRNTKTLVYPWLTQTNRTENFWQFHLKYKVSVLFIHFSILGSSLLPYTVLLSKIILKDPRCRVIHGDFPAESAELTTSRVILVLRRRVIKNVDPIISYRSHPALISAWVSNCGTSPEISKQKILNLLNNFFISWRFYNSSLAWPTPVYTGHGVAD